jgi:hypothetical protein
MTDHHDEHWKHPWAVRLSRLVCDDSLSARFDWHDEARGLVMEIEQSSDVLAALKALVAGVERDDNPRDEGHCEHSDEMKAARVAIAKAEILRENGVRPSVGNNH